MMGFGFHQMPGSMGDLEKGCELDYTIKGVMQQVMLFCHRRNVTIEGQSLQPEGRLWYLGYGAGDG